MITLRSRLPWDREREGTFWVEESDGRLLMPEQRARGEADNANAARQNNVVEDPTRVGGDHPGGTYRVVQAISFHESDREHWLTYGPWFFRLDPLAGEALRAKDHGRTGIGIHGGAPSPAGGLRATYGCLRLFNSTMLALARLIVPLGPDVHYDCEIVQPPETA